MEYVSSILNCSQVVRFAESTFYTQHKCMYLEVLEVFSLLTLRQPIILFNTICDTQERLSGQELCSIAVSRTENNAQAVQDVHGALRSGNIRSDHDSCFHVRPTPNWSWCRRWKVKIALKWGLQSFRMGRSYRLTGPPIWSIVSESNAIDGSLCFFE